MPNTLTISFTPANPAPSNGYRVRYWATSSPDIVTTVSPNPTSSPVTISGLIFNSYAGTIEAACGGGNYSSITSFSASTSGTSYNAISTYYIPCVITSSNNLTANDIYFISGVTDIATGVQLYNSVGGAITTVSMIADLNGNLYNVDSNGVVTTYTGIVC